MKETVTASDPRIMLMTAQADDITAMCRQLKEEYHPLLHGKRFITDAMLSELLGVCRRTTQDYRDRGLIPYYKLDGKILYAEEDVEIFLNPKNDNGNRSSSPGCRCHLFFVARCQFIITQSNFWRIFTISSEIVLSCIRA